jgi:hypothetical protein
MKQPTRRARTLSTAIVTPLAIVAAGAMVWQSSYSAFSGTTRNSGNSWSTGSVALTDDDEGTARFQAKNLVPQQTETKCIAVTTNTNVPGVVKGYALNPIVSAAKLEDHIKVTIEHGNGGGFGSCDGFTKTGDSIPTPTSLTTLANAKDFATGVGGWNVPAGTQTRTYKITYLFDTTNLSQSQLDGLQGAQTGIDFQWELQSS